jgi:hypothetical protein
MGNYWPPYLQFASLAYALIARSSSRVFNNLTAAVAVVRYNSNIDWRRGNGKVREKSV